MNIYYCMKNIRAIFVVLASFMGVGFATGKEIFVFYAKFGLMGVVNIILTMVLLYQFTLFYLNNMKMVFNDYMFSKKVKYVKNIAFLICYIIVCAALFAGVNGFDKLLKIESVFPIGIMGFVTLVLTLIISFGGINSISYMNLILVPIMILGYIIVCILVIIKSGFQIEFTNFNTNAFMSVLNGFNYVGINTILTINLFASVSKQKCVNKKVCLGIVLIFGILLMIGMFALIFGGYVESEMPILYLSFKVNNFIGFCYIIVIWLSILTSLISIIYAIKECLGLFIKNNILKTIISVLLCYALGFLGFGNFVEYLYPIIGAVGVGYFFTMRCICCKYNTKHIMYKNTNKQIKIH